MVGKISELVELITQPADDDELEIRDISEALAANQNKRITVINLTKKTFTDVIPCVMEVPEGTNCYPDVHTLATGGTKVDGFVLPNGAGVVSIFNAKCVIPKDLAATPNMKIRLRIMTMGAVAGPADLRLTISSKGFADTENMDSSLTAETETTVVMPTTTESLDYYSHDLTTDWAADDTVLIQVKRDSADVADDFTDDVMIVGVDLLVDRTVS